MTLKQINHALKAFTMLTPALLLTGCASHQLVTQPQTQSPPTSLSIETTSTTHAQDQVTSILESVIQQNSTTITKSQSVGPQLIAGDWLAWQCAIAGNYFNTNELNNAPTSMFASSPTDSE